MENLANGWYKIRLKSNQSSHVILPDLVFMSGHHDSPGENLKLEIVDDLADLLKKTTFKAVSEMSIH